MAGQDNLLSRIIALVAGFDDSSWEALASKGLLRRARKDMEKGHAIEIAGECGDALQVKVPPFLVLMPAIGPAKATCTCATPGVCQHILAAGLYLQAQQPAIREAKSGMSADSIRDEIAHLTLDRLKQWAGSADCKAGVSVLERNSLPPVIEYQETVLVRLMPSGVEVRFVLGGGLDGMILPKSLGKRAGVAAILALRRSLGLEVPTAEAQESLIEITGTPRTKKEILASASAVLEDAIAVGLSHLSPMTADRLMTLAVSAQGASLPRVALALKTVSDEINSTLQREARADEGRILLAAARLYALMDAISAGGENPRIELAGVQRTQYVDVPEIEVSGVGAYTWKTGSGYAGLTVLFWSNQTQEFLSWSEARPSAQKFDPRQRFYGGGPWDGTQSPQQVAASNLKLRNARRTAKGRLSSSTKTSVVVLGPTAPNSLGFATKLFTSWTALQRYVYEKQPLGLSEPSPLDLIGVLEPSTFGAQAFDSITQTFTWDVYDDADQLLRLSLPFRDWSNEAIRALEAMSPPQELRWRILARLALRDEALELEPVSILRPDNPNAPIFQLAFDTVPQQTAQSFNIEDGTEGEESPDEESEVDEVPDHSGAYLHSAIHELNRRLQAIAETGSRNGLRGHRPWLEKVAQEFHNSGLTCLASTVERLRTESSKPARVILQVRYLAHLHAQATAHVL